MKYTLVLLEKRLETDYNLVSSCFEIWETFQTLEGAKIAQKGQDLKTIIIPTY